MNGIQGPDTSGHIQVARAGGGTTKDLWRIGNVGEALEVDPRARDDHGTALSELDRIAFLGGRLLDMYRDAGRELAVLRREGRRPGPAGIRTRACIERNAWLPCDHGLTVRLFAEGDGGEVELARYACGGVDEPHLTDSERPDEYAVVMWDTDGEGSRRRLIGQVYANSVTHMVRLVPGRD